MSTITPLTNKEIDYLHPFLPGNTSTEYAVPCRPRVTLTYASSLDGLVSISPGFRTIISGPETKSMTHYLRMHHDAILVGVDTAIYDDPALNCRYPDVTFTNQPQPIIIDSSLRWDPTSKQVLQLNQQTKGKKPWIFHRAGSTIPDGYPQNDVELIPLESNHRHLEWVDILSSLKTRGINSIMIEGGASILSALLNRPELVDAIIVTIAPTWLGSDGSSKHVVPRRSKDDGEANAARLDNVAWLQFGQDMVLCGRLQQKPPT